MDHCLLRMLKWLKSLTCRLANFFVTHLNGELEDYYDILKWIEIK